VMSIPLPLNEDTVFSGRAATALTENFAWPNEETGLYF